MPNRMIKEDILTHLGKIVETEYDHDGLYIGELLAVRRKKDSRGKEYWAARVRVLAVKQYPGSALNIPDSGTLELTPYASGTVLELNALTLAPFRGPVPDYLESLGHALDRSIAYWERLKGEDEFLDEIIVDTLKTLLDHKRLFEGGKAQTKGNG